PFRESRGVVAPDGSRLETGRTERTYDPSRRVVVESREAIDPARVAITRMTYDMATGLLLTSQSPGEVARGSAAVSRTVYDPYRVTVRETINELGHRVRTEYDLGTRAVLRVQGPRFTCPAGAEACPEPRRIYQVEEQRHDGLGRLRERWRAFDDGPGAYRLVQVEKRRYLDFEWW